LGYKKLYYRKALEVATGMKNKILVIEDDRAISELLCMNLEAAGYETVAAYDGEEAQRLLLWQEDADLAVVDIMLPGKDGFALMEDFKKNVLYHIMLERFSGTSWNCKYQFIQNKNRKSKCNTFFHVKCNL
jgi:PleD family two-component response regulator